MASRRRSAARLAAAQALYQADLTGATADSVLRDLRQGRLGGHALTEDPESERETAVPLVDADSELLGTIVAAALSRLDDIDGMIAGALATGWSPDRLEPVVRSVLRAGVAELLERPDVPARVVITEYVDVAHAFYAGPEPGLVNAVLDRLARLLRPADFTAPDDKRR